MTVPLYSTDIHSQVLELKVLSCYEIERTLLINSKFYIIEVFLLGNTLMYICTCKVRGLDLHGLYFMRFTACNTGISLLLHNITQLVALQ